jgi:peptide/nickel transport system substrate-binding protein
VTWPDGQKLTAEDLAFTIGQVMERRWPQRTYIETLTRWVAPSPDTLALTSSRVDITLLTGSTYIWVLPKHYYERVGFEQFVVKPMGSGPYEMTEYKVADTIRYKKRAQDHAFRKVVLDEILIRAVPEAQQQQNGLLTGESHIAVASWTPEQADRLKGEGNTITAYPAAVGGVRIVQSTYERTNSPLKDIRVRQAMNYAINRPELVNLLYKSYGKPDSQFAVEGSRYHDTSVPIWPYDVARAKQLLAQAGYPNGITLKMDYSPAMSSATLINALLGYFKEIGVTVEANTFELGVYVDKVYGRNGQLLADISPGGQGDSNLLHTGARVFVGCGKPGPSQTLYCNPEWDRLLDAAYQERDEARSRTLMLQANKVFRDDVPVVFLYTASVFTSSGAKVRGYEVRSPLSYDFDKVYLVK